MTIVVSPKARDDLREAFEYIRKDSPEAADRVLARIVEILGLLASEVMAGREVILRGGQRVHAWSVPPYRIYYRKTVNELQVVRVYHQARRQIER